MVWKGGAHRSRLSAQAPHKGDAALSTAFLNVILPSATTFDRRRFAWALVMPSWGVGVEDEALKMSVRILSLFGHRDYAALRQTKGMNERASARRRNWELLIGQTICRASQAISDLGRACSEVPVDNDGPLWRLRVFGTRPKDSSSRTPQDPKQREFLKSAFGRAKEVLGRCCGKSRAARAHTADLVRSLDEKGGALSRAKWRHSRSASRRGAKSVGRVVVRFAARLGARTFPPVREPGVTDDKGLSVSWLI